MDKMHSNTFELKNERKSKMIRMKRPQQRMTEKKRKKNNTLTYQNEANEKEKKRAEERIFSKQRINDKLCMDK